MTEGWIGKAGRFTVDRVAVPHDLIPCDMSKPPAGILHTTEGSWESAMSVFSVHFAPNFMVGRDAAGRTRIAQFVPIGMMSAALENDRGGVETNRWARAQIEIVGFSSLKPWRPGEAVSEALAALFGAIRDHPQGKVPLSRPFPDTLDPSVTWASQSNPRRNSGKWGKTAGWFGHVEVPENAHWDAGSLQVRDIFKMVESPTRKVTGYTVTWTAQDGETRKTANIASPEKWLDGHPKAKLRGSVVFRRRFD